MYQFIKEGEINLRQILPEDREKFLLWHNDEQLRNMIGGIFPFSENVFHEICSSKTALQAPSNVWFAVCKKEKLIGIAGLHNIKYIQRNAEIACLIGDEPERKRGYGALAVELLKRYAFNSLNLHRMYAYVNEYNLPCICLLEKIGFNKEGILRDAEYWNGMYRDVILFASIASEG